MHRQRRLLGLGALTTLLVGARSETDDPVLALEDTQHLPEWLHVERLQANGHELLVLREPRSPDLRGPLVTHSIESPPVLLPELEDLRRLEMLLTRRAPTHALALPSVPITDEPLLERSRRYVGAMRLVERAIERMNASQP